MTAIVYVPATGNPARIAALAVECARVGAGAVQVADDATAEAVRAATELVVLLPGDGPRTLLLGDTPVSELHDELTSMPADQVVVGGFDVSALLAGLAAGTHLRAGSADTPGDGSVRHDVQLVARAAALARLAGRPPWTPDQIRQNWGSR